MTERIELGQVVRDRITGFEGVATARCEYLSGDTRVCVEAHVNKDGKVQEEWISETRLDIV